MKERIKGAILIYSCHKHKDTRLKEFRLTNDEYDGWKVFYILGNPSIEKDYMTNDNTILLKCEDSYIHVAKKVVLGIKFVFDKYEIEEGILRCGDDLIFDENNLVEFLKMQNKQDYMGVVANQETTNIVSETNFFMPSYYYSHQEELSNPLNCIKLSINELMSLNQVPKLKYAGGVIVYLSKKSCDVLVSHFESIEWNVFQSHPIYGYPYIIEDISVGYILYINNIHVQAYPFYVDNPSLKNNTTIAIHTNKYK